MSRVLALLLFLFSLGWPTTSCSGEHRSDRTDDRGPEVRYFAGIAGLAHPFKLDHELTEDEAREAGKYFRGTFDRGRVVRIERYIDGELLFDYEYTYNPRGNLSRALLKSEGETRVLRYDEHGRLIE